MSSNMLNPEDLLLLKENVKSAIIEMLPEMIKEFIPVITQVFKEK